MILQKDPLGGYKGVFEFKGDNFDYHVEGTGSPILITMDISARGGSYTWRYIFDCLAGAFKVYSLDVLGIERNVEELKYGPGHYSDLIKHFLANVIKEKTSIISGPVEAPFTMKAISEEPALIDRVLLVSPDGVHRIVMHDKIARTIVHEIIRIPKMESIKLGNVASKRSMLHFISELYQYRRPSRPGIRRFKYPPLLKLTERRFTRPALDRSLMEAPARLINQPRQSYRFLGEMEDFRIIRSARLIIFQRSGELPRKKEALRFCDDAIKFLG